MQQQYAPPVCYAPNGNPYYARAWAWPLGVLMSLRRHLPDTGIYRPRSAPDRTCADDPPDLIVQAIYRGYRLACVAAEIESVKRKIDAGWAERYLGRTDAGNSLALGRGLGGTGMGAGAGVTSQSIGPLA
jgi:hypothetical protein